MAAILSAFKYAILPSLTHHFHRPAPRFTQRSPRRPPGAHAVRDVHVHVRPGRHHGPTVRRRQGHAARREPLPTTLSPRSPRAQLVRTGRGALYGGTPRPVSHSHRAHLTPCTQRPYSARRTQNGSDGSTASGSPPRSARSRPKCVSTSSSTPPVSAPDSRGPAHAARSRPPPPAIIAAYFTSMALMEGKSVADARDRLRTVSAPARRNPALYLDKCLLPQAYPPAIAKSW